jgi:hypothetical protein
VVCGSTVSTYLVVEAGVAEAALWKEDDVCHNDWNSRKDRARCYTHKTAEVARRLRLGVWACGVTLVVLIKGLAVRRTRWWVQHGAVTMRERDEGTQQETGFHGELERQRSKYGC